MEYRRLGKSGPVVSAVGFGTCQLRLLPESLAIDTLLKSFELGVNIVHTGPDYGVAQDLVAKAVARTDRKIIVASHGADRPSDGRGPVRHFEAQFEATCARLGSERLDLYGIACIDDREAFKENVWGGSGMVAFLHRKKQEGRLGATFCTTHGAPAYVKQLATSGAFDAVMIAYNVLGYHLLSCYPTPGRHFESLERSKQEIFPLCRQQDVGLMIMKPLGGGLLCESPAFPSRRVGKGAINHARARDVLRSILLNPEVTCVVPGTNSIAEAEENACSGEGPFTVGAQEQRELAALVKELRQTVCSRCGKCEPVCSQGMPISWMFRAALINLHPSARHEVLEHMDYFRLHPQLEAPCASCTNRTCVCPDGIDIPNSLADMHRHMVDLMNKGLIPGPRLGAPPFRVGRADNALLLVSTDRSIVRSSAAVGRSCCLGASTSARDLCRSAVRSSGAGCVRLAGVVRAAIRAARGRKVLRRLGRGKGVEPGRASLMAPGAARASAHAFEGALDATASDASGLPAFTEPLHDWNLNPCVHPLEAAHGYAGHVVDLQGRDFIDFSSAWGASILGYGYPRVAEAVAAQAQRFAGIGMPYPGFRELELLLRDVIPGAEQVRFGKNGSDATMGAVRLARAITRRERVLHRGYHGFHDWWMASTDCQGIPAALKALIAPLPAFTAEEAEHAFRQHPGEIACVILDPMIPPTPEAETVREIMAIAHRHGALMILDEVVSGFRLAPGGIQEIWGLQPDLACHGKAVANGLPLSVLSGKHEHMRPSPQGQVRHDVRGRSDLHCGGPGDRAGDPREERLRGAGGEGPVSGGGVRATGRAVRRYDASGWPVRATAPRVREAAGRP